MARQTKETRGSRGSGSVRQRPDGRWEARCTINGRTRSFYGARQADALKAMRAAQQEADEGTYIDPSTLTFGRWVDIWLEEYSKPTIKPNTYASRRILINTHIKPKLGGVRLQAIDTSILQGFYNGLRAEGLAPSSIQVYHASIHSALDRAVKLRYINFNPAKACVLPRGKRRDLAPLTDVEIANLLTIIRADSLRDLLLVTLFTGMREGEICGLPWDAVDFEAGTITVKQQLVKDWGRRGSYTIGSTKNGRSRTLTPPPFVLELLHDVRREQTERAQEAGDLWCNEHDLVFTDPIGGYILPSMAYRHFKRAAEKIGRADARFHDLRHTYAVIALQEGDNPKTVQEALGHATATFTMDVYAHVSEKMRRESAERMQGYIDRMEG